MNEPLSEKYYKYEIRVEAMLFFVFFFFFEFFWTLNFYISSGVANRAVVAHPLNAARDHGLLSR